MVDGRIELDLNGISPRNLRLLFEEVVETVERLTDDEGLGIVHWQAYEINKEAK